MVSHITGILNRHDPQKETGIPKKVNFDIPENDEVSVTYKAADGLSTKDRLYARDVRKDFQKHGRHWFTAHKLDIHTFEEYWHFLLRDHRADTADRKPKSVYITVDPLFDLNKTLNRIVVNFGYLENGKLRHKFKEMSLEVPAAKDWLSKQAWKQQTAQVLCKGGKVFAVKIGDLKDAERDAFMQAIHTCRHLLRLGGYIDR
ncbi:MAG: hypothetical protein Q9221_005846 [Calogaya cf. arnoldii]